MLYGKVAILQPSNLAVRSRFFVLASRSKVIVAATSWWTDPIGPFRRTRPAPTAWRMLTSRGSASGAQILPGFSAFLRARVDRIGKSLGRRIINVRDNEGVARTAGIRPADKAVVRESALRNNTARPRCLNASSRIHGGEERRDDDASATYMTAASAAWLTASLLRVRLGGKFPVSTLTSTRSRTVT